MQATANEARRDTTETLNEATRTAAETSRRTIEHLQAATQAGRGWLEESSQLNRRLFGAWLTGLEATLKASFEMQNAALTASIPIFDTAAHQMVTLARQAQEATLDALRVNVRLMEKVTLGPTGKEAAPR
jgi:hypothetical protein